MKEYRTIKVRFYGNANDQRGLIVEGPLDGSGHWFDTLKAIYPKHEVLSYGTAKHDIV